MNLTKLHDPKYGVLNLIGFISGEGTNLRKVIEHERSLSAAPGSSPYHVCAIFSDNARSLAPEIGRDYNLPVIIRDIGSFYGAHGYTKRDMCLRPSFDAETIRVLEPFNTRFAVFAGYMSIASNLLIKSYTAINVHPGDLTIMKDGKPRWTGGHAVYDAIMAGEKTLRSTTHIVEPDVDCGRVLMLSRQVRVSLPNDSELRVPDQAKAIAARHQKLLKETGDWEILPLTIEYIAKGRYSIDDAGGLYFDSLPVPQGVKLD
jgi:folate-dependent phosphoribosylglycinamide formyltransferase PurN